jgi:hypothetical protein
LFERKLDNLDCAVNASAKTTWRGQKQPDRFFERWLFSHAPCSLVKVAAYAKTFPLLRGPQWGDKDQITFRTRDPSLRNPRITLYELRRQSPDYRYCCSFFGGLLT